jgi:FkbM family methyltransferase
MNNFDEGSRLSLVEAAAGASAGSVTLARFDEPYRNAVATSAAHGAPAGTALVPQVTLDGVCAERGLQPTWIRMDVQGAEFDVLWGARETLRRGRGRMRVVAEMHPSSWPAFGLAPDRVPGVLAELGLEARSLVPGHDPFEQDAHAELTWIER